MEKIIIPSRGEEDTTVSLMRLRTEDIIYLETPFFIVFTYNRYKGSSSSLHNLYHSSKPVSS